MYGAPMATPVPLLILSRRNQRNRLIIVLLGAALTGVVSRLVRPLISGPVHYEALATVVLLSVACLVLLLGLRQIAYRRAVVTYAIEVVALWGVFAVAWSIIDQRLRHDLVAVIGLFWAVSTAVGLFILWIIQKAYPPRRSMTCGNCEYDLKGLTGSTCPECGTSFRASCLNCGAVLPRLDAAECADCEAPIVPGSVVLT